jgi:hypothetical protein
MSSTVRFHSGAVVREVVNHLVVGALLAGFAFCQAAVDKNKVSDAIEKARPDNPESIYYVEQIGHSKALQAVPMLEEKFARTKDPMDKAKIAQVLIKLGDKNEIYWDFLVKLATPALESDAPDFMSYDSQGKSAPGPSPEFIAWAKAHNVSPNGPNGTAAEDSIYNFPGAVGFLGFQEIRGLFRFFDKPCRLLTT